MNRTERTYLNTVAETLDGVPTRTSIRCLAMLPKIVWPICTPSAYTDLVTTLDGGPPR